MRRILLFLAFIFVVSAYISNETNVTFKSINKKKNDYKHHSRNLQFEGMYDLNNNNVQVMQSKRNKLRKNKANIAASRGNAKGIIVFILLLIYM